jgi:hypothetical protein
MKLTPLLFKAEMVRALLDGTKTQTRRVAKLSKHYANCHLELEGDELMIVNNFDPESRTSAICPYGQVGDQIWVKETWRTWTSLDQVKPSNLADGCLIEYAAGGNNYAENNLYAMSKNWRSPLFMQKRFSRITLEITNVRVERLNNISVSDAIAEGVDVGDFADIMHDVSNGISIIDRYRDLWDSINGKGAWHKNPWVWVIEFKVVKP